METLGLATEIVKTLQRYKRVPISFLASVLKMDESEVAPYIAELTEAKVVTREGGDVMLAKAGDRAVR